MSQRIPALDSLRGFFLILMTLDHLGGPIAKVLYGSFGYVSAAEGFFFLSGFVATKVALRKPNAASWFRQRSRKIWSWHILALIVVCLLAIALSPLGWKLIPGMENLRTQPIGFALGAISLLHLPDYLDVLPLYVFLMLAASVILPRCASAVKLLLGSALVWGLAQMGAWQTIRSVLPIWMHAGVFDPLAWQFIFFGGAALAMAGKQEFHWWKSPSVLWVSGCAAMAFFMLKHGIIGNFNFPDFLFWNSRTELGPLRIANAGIFVLFFSALIYRFPTALDFRFPALLGRNSLYVFSFHIPLVYLWQFRPIQSIGLSAFFVPLTIVILLGIPALLREKS